MTWWVGCSRPAQCEISTAAPQYLGAKQAGSVARDAGARFARVTQNAKIIRKSAVNLTGPFTVMSNSADRSAPSTQRRTFPAFSGASGVAASSSTVLSQEHRLPIPIPPRQTEVPSGSPSRSRRGARISSSCHIFATCRSRCQRRVAVSHRRRRSSRAIPVRRSASCANRRPSVCRRHTLALRVLTKQQLDDAIERAGSRRVFAACLSMKDYCRETRSVEA